MGAVIALPCATAAGDIPVPFDADLLAGLEATNATTGNHETVEIGPLFGRYLVLSAPDLLASLDELKRLIDKAEAAVLDARQDQADAARHACDCGTLIDPDEDHCGSIRCARRLADERRHEALI